MPTKTRKHITPAFAEVYLPGSDEPSFVGWDEAISDLTMRRQVVAAALQELESFVLQYRLLDELSGFCAEVERLLKRQKTKIDT